MMFTVYIGETPVSFVDGSRAIPHVDGVMYSSYSASDTMKLFIEMLEENKEVKALIIRHLEPETAFSEFCSQFRLIAAAGGVVYNAQGKKLMIFRNGKWDLPKGKIEAGEPVEAAAVREVTEECGIGNLRIHKPLPPTYHTYSVGSERILKKTFWYEMHTDSTDTPVPQAEEGITQAKWMNEQDQQMALRNTYASVKDVLNNTVYQVAGGK
jgi:8-oxo-dGTP pyrophosphatase MutT (NUDIX family)